MVVLIIFLNTIVSVYQEKKLAHIETRVQSTLVHVYRGSEDSKIIES